MTFKGFPQEAELPSAPKQFIQYLEEDNRPQVQMDVNYENGILHRTKTSSLTENSKAIREFAKDQGLSW